MSHATRLAIAPAAALLLLAGGCGGPGGGTGALPTTSPLPSVTVRLPDPAPGIPDRCAPGGGRTVTDGALTIAVDDPAYEPWIIGNDPANGQGFEGSVARAVAGKLGYTPELVRYTRVPFNDALLPGAKAFDFSINQFTIYGDRRENVDFSSPYYAVAQAVVALADNPAAQATGLAGLGGFRIGAQAGSTSVAAVNESIRPVQPVTEYPSTEDASAALAAGQIDALVVDLPTGVYLAAAAVPGATVVGRFPSPNAVTEFFGLVLQKDSAFTECVSIALDQLYAEGVLFALAEQWLGGYADVPTLQ